MPMHAHGVYRLSSKTNHTLCRTRLARKWCQGCHEHTTTQHILRPSICLLGVFAIPSHPTAKGESGRRPARGTDGRVVVPPSSCCADWSARGGRRVALCPLRQRGPPIRSWYTEVHLGQPIVTGDPCAGFAAQAPDGIVARARDAARVSTAPWLQLLRRHRVQKSVELPMASAAAGRARRACACAAAGARAIER